MATRNHRNHYPLSSQDELEDPLPVETSSINIQWKIVIESAGWKEIDLSSFSQGSIQPRNSFRLGLFQDAVLMVENCKVHEKVHDAAWIPHSTPWDRGIGLSGAQLLNNLQMNPPALLAQSPF